VRTIGYWLTGIGLLQVGHAIIRVLEQFVPKDPDVTSLPWWTAGLHAVAAPLLLWAGRGVREGRPLARAVGVAWIVAWVAATFLGINTDSLDVKHFGPGSAARGGVFRATAWPAMLGCLDGYMWRPTGLWRSPEYVAAAVTDVLGVTMIALLVRGVRLPAGADRIPADRPALLRAALVREEAKASFGARVLRAALALHVAGIAIFQVIAVIGLCAKVAGWRAGG